MTLSFQKMQGLLEKEKPQRARIMDIHRRYRRLMRNGWNIPKTMEWLFWPISIVVQDADGRWKCRSAAPVDGPTVAAAIQLSLCGRARVLNREDFMVVLKDLGVVREAPPRP